MDSMEIKDEIDHMTGYWREQMPAKIRELIRRLNHDLCSGPSYYDAGDNECSCFDEGATPFAFDAALHTVLEWTDIIQDVRVETYYDAETDMSECEQVDGSAKQIIRTLVGNELAAML